MLNRATLTVSALVALLLLAGCPNHPSVVGCTDSTVCTLMAGGQCIAAPVGFDVCAYPSTECPSGLAWSPEAGDLAGQCVAADVDAGTDAPDARPDAANVGCPARIAFYDGAPNSREVYAVNPDGTGVTNLSTDAASDSRPHWSQVGNLVAFESNRTGNAEIFTVDGGGSTPRNVTQNAAADQRPIFSPDGSKIAFSRQAAGAPTPSLWVMNSDGTNARELSTLPVWQTTTLSWSPDSMRIAFVATRDVYTVGLTGAAPTNLCTWTSGSCDDPAWSPDGTRVAMGVFANSNSEIYTVNAADGSNPTNITNAPTAEDVRPRWSPDGTAIAFSSTRNGSFEIFRTAVPVAGEPLRLTMHDNTINDVGPVWSPDGTRLAFVRGMGSTAKLAVIAADGTNYTDFAVATDPIGPTWSQCQ